MWASSNTWRRCNKQLLPRGINGISLFSSFAFLLLFLNPPLCSLSTTLARLFLPFLSLFCSSFSLFFLSFAVTLLFLVHSLPALILMTPKLRIPQFSPCNCCEFCIFSSSHCICNFHGAYISPGSAGFNCTENCLQAVDSSELLNLNTFQ